MSKKKRKTKKEISIQGLSMWLDRQAKYNRINANEYEKKLYKILKDLGYKFKFQAPLIYKTHGYIVDYLLSDYPIFIEADGKKWHSSPEQIKKDNLRTRRIRTLGYYPIRLTNRQITTYTPKDINDIIQFKIQMLKN